MNPLLSRYLVDVQHPEVSGAEHLQMLQTRDQIAIIEAALSSEERVMLYKADRQFIEQAATFYAEVARFMDLTDYRTRQAIDPARWWWYLDVIRQLPLESVPPAPILNVS